MGKPIIKTRLSVDNAPTPQRKPTSDAKLGFVSKKASKMRAYRLRVETIEALSDITKKANKKVNIKLSATSILELLITDAAKNNIDRVVGLIKDNTN